MAQLSTVEIKRGCDAAWQIKDLWKSVLEEAYSLALAGKNPYTGTDQGPKPMDQQFDSTAPQSVVKAANRLLMELTPPDQAWVDLRPGPLLELQLASNKPELDRLKKQLSATTSIVSMVFSSGNFINSIWEVYIDLLVAGMGVMLVLEDTTNDVEPVMFQSVSQSEVAVVDDARGQPERVYRRRKIKIRLIEGLWSDAKLTKDLKEMMKNKKDAEIEVIEAAYAGGTKSDVAWYYDVVCCTGGGDPVRIVAREYNTNPWNIFRWSKLPGCPYGPGPILLLLPTIRTVNKVIEMLLKNAALALAGMYLVRDDGVLNPDNVMITQGGMIPVAATGGSVGASMVPLETGRDFSVSQLVLEKMQTEIKKGLFDASLPDLDGTVRSPTEILHRARELTQDVGGAMGRMTSDLVTLVRRVMDVLSSRGFIPSMKVDQYTLKAQINSPLARGQQMQEVQNIVQWLQLIISLGGPAAAMLSAKMEDIFAYIADLMGIPPILVRDEEERLKMQQDAAQAAAVQQATAALPSQAA